MCYGKFKKKLIHSIVEKDAEGLLDFVVIQVPNSGYVQFPSMKEGGFYVEFAVEDSADSREDIRYLIGCIRNVDTNMAREIRTTIFISRSIRQEVRKI